MWSFAINLYAWGWPNPTSKIVKLPIWLQMQACHLCCVRQSHPPFLHYIFRGFRKCFWNILSTNLLLEVKIFLSMPFLYDVLKDKFWWVGWPKCIFPWHCVWNLAALLLTVLAKKLSIIQYSPIYVSFFHALNVVEGKIGLSLCCNAFEWGLSIHNDWL